MKVSADLIWDGQRFVDNAVLEIKDGCVARIQVANGQQENKKADKNYSRCAIIPGFANAHSHAFQRAFRGQTEWSTKNIKDDFWSWRNIMYQYANQLSPDDLYVVTAWTFLEMVKAGITAVGEFHYVHHQKDGAAYTPKSLMSLKIIDAARDVGLKLTLLPVAYHRGGFNRSINTDQRRFSHQTPENYLALVQSICESARNISTVQVGLAPHSIRACDTTWLRACGMFSKKHQLVTHIHVCEQPREIDECQKEHGMAPIELLKATGLLNEKTTLVHATHLTGNESELIRESGSIVCACPTTEANLGDGFFPAHEFLTKDIPICLGTDSHAQIDLFQEARLLEIQQRLQLQQRNVLTRYTNREPENEQHLSDTLFPMMTSRGYKSLGWSGGQLKPGSTADFIVIDLEHPSIFGVPPESLLDGLILGASPSAVSSVYVAGRCVIENGSHPMEKEMREAYRSLLKRLVQSDTGTFLKTKR